jgi:two-component system OmpR family response regulator
MTTKPHIFLVEDDLSFGAVLKSYLEISDFEVDWIDDGQHALNHFKGSSFDVCILDVMLPNDLQLLPKYGKLIPKFRSCS